MLIVILKISPSAKPAFFWFIKPRTNVLHSFSVLYLVCGIGKVICKTMVHYVTFISNKSKQQVKIL